MAKKINIFGKAMPYLLGLVFVLSTLIKLFYITDNNFAFTSDQGRDLVDIRRMVVTHTPRLVGPTTSINGVLLGPFYYYFISVPFILSGGSPMAIVIWQIFWYQFAVLFIWYILKKKNLVLANTVAILMLITPVGFNTARYFWNANVMPIFTIIYFATLIWASSPDMSLRGVKVTCLPAGRRGNLYRLFVLGLISGISLQIEAAFGILFFPFAVMYLLFTSLRGAERRGNLTPSRTLLPLSIGFLITLIPQILFEFRHGFMMTQTLMAGLLGRSADLGAKLPFMERLLERREVFVTAMRQSNHISFEILGPVFVVALLLGVYFLVKRDKKMPGNRLIFISLGFIVFAGIFYLIFPQHLKDWYVFGLSIPFILLLSGVLANLSKLRFGSIFLWLFILYSISHTFLAHIPAIYENSMIPSGDPSNMALEISAVDWVYKEAAGQPFKVYNYLPSIYDFTYQYLFWWHGTRKYGYQPADISYLPDVPEYIQDNDTFWTKKKLFQEENPTFLIMQGDSVHQDKVYAWGGHFTNLCQIKSIAISSGLSISKLGSCQAKSP